jgi:adenylate cyclase
VPEMPHAGRHRLALPPDPAGGAFAAVDDVETRLLGQPRSMGRREVSARASVSLHSARKFWHALGFPDFEDEDTVFTGADLRALQSVAAMVRDGMFDEPTALAMTRALARTTGRLAVWQTQLMAEAVGEPSSIAAPTEIAEAEGDGAGPAAARALPDPAVARAAAMRRADIADDLEPLLIYAWRRHLLAAISQMGSDCEPTRPAAEA